MESNSYGDEVPEENNEAEVTGYSGRGENVNRARGAGQEQHLVQGSQSRGVRVFAGMRIGVSNASRASSAKGAKGRLKPLKFGLSS